MKKYKVEKVFMFDGSDENDTANWEVTPGMVKAMGDADKADAALARAEAKARAEERKFRRGEM